MYDAARDRLGAGPHPRRRRPARDRRRSAPAARACDQALVLTGGASRGDAEAADPRPTFIADSLATLVLAEHKEGLSLFMFPAHRGVHASPRGCRRRRSARRASREGVRADRLASRAVIDGPVCLIVNPHAGGGRALRLLPGVEAALRSQGRPFRVVETMSMQHARELAREACDAGDIVAAMGGDGIVGAVAGELRDGQGLLAVLPGGRGNDFARKLDIPFDPVEAVEAAARRARSAASTSRVANGTVYLGILSAGIDSDVSAGSRSRRGSSSARSSTPMACCARSPAGSPPPGRSRSTASRSTIPGYSVAVANSGVFGGGMFLAPDASLEDGKLDVVLIAPAVQPALPARPPARVQRQPPQGPRDHAPPGPRDHLRAPTARSRPTPTATRSATCR